MIKTTRNAGANAMSIRQALGNGPKANIGIVPLNVAGDKRVILKLRHESGDIYEAFASPNVSQGIRDKEIRISDLWNFIVVERESSTGEPINVVQMPESETVWAKDSKKETKYQSKTVSHQELIAWSDE